MHTANRKSLTSWLIPIGLLLFLASVALSQTESPNATPPAESRTHTLSGTVVNSVTGEPVRRAMVQATPGNAVAGVSLLTDSEGRFEFPALPESDIIVMAHKPGYFAASDLNPTNFQPDIVSLVSDVSSVALKLMPEGVVAGRVATTKGEPIEDSPVRIFREVFANGYRHWEGHGQTSTDADGQFRVGGLTPGRYLLATGPNLPIGNALRNRKARKEGYGTVFYPGVPDMDAATPLVISGGQQAQADFALKFEPIFHIAGTLVGFTPGSGVGVQFASKSGEVIPSPVDVDVQTGKFQGFIPGGSYILQARGSDSTGRVAATDLPLVVNSDVEGITLALGSSISMPVNIDLRPTAGSTAQAAIASSASARDFAVSSVRLIPSDPRMDNTEAQAEKSERGGLAFANLRPGRYAVEISTTQPWYVRSATIGATDLLREELVVGAGRRLDPLELVLRDDGASLKVQVSAEEQPAAGSVLLFADQTLLTNARTGSSAAGVPIEFAGLAPGEYKALAFDREMLDNLEFRNPEVLAPYMSKAATVTLHAGEEATVNVERQGAGK